MINKFNKEVKESQQVLSSLQSTIEELLATKNGTGIKGWFALIKLKDSIHQTVNSILEVEDELKKKEDSSEVETVELT